MKKTNLLLMTVAALSAMGCQNASGGENPSRTDVPDELVGAWQSSPIDFNLWENYREGYYAGRNAVPMREAMVFERNGDAKYYRYQYAFVLYEELIDCDGTVAFSGDATFAFHPVKCRKRFYNTRHSDENSDRALTEKELADPKLAGQRSYSYDASSNPPVLTLKVPSSPPYNWYKKLY